MKSEQLIKKLKEKIEKRKERCKIYGINMHKDRELARLKAQLQFAEKLTKAIKDDVNGLLNYFDELRGGMLNRVNVLDFYDELNKILDEALK